jgi:hypothetical protein
MKRLALILVIVYALAWTATIFASSPARAGYVSVNAQPAK